MKILLLFVGAVALFSLTANAGNMFGPAPFRNGSPLVTGVDGTYQATARAENVTGIFRFAYSEGSQTSNQLQNNWIFFVAGQIQRGGVVANINDSSIDGILDPQGIEFSSANSTQTNNSITLPYVVINQNNSSAGTFQGQIDLKNPNGSFNGQGTLQGIPLSTDQIIGVSQLDALELNLNGNTPAGSIFVSSATITNAAGSLPITEFRFRGVRTSINAQPSVTPVTPTGN